MSFDGDQARLIKELADAQAEIRAQFGLAPRVKPTAGDRLDEPMTPGKRAVLGDS